mmetsp:Transcript_63519/g.187516  ORF Transcript_63519/g.187516 Transcript_63519/m.187516 type:complete len:209 (-) Transcript_63519:37-663(-)
MVFLFIVLVLSAVNAGCSLELTSTPPLLDVPTYSLATLGRNGRTGMNILTYATPVSIRPERVWSIGLFKGTVAHENFRDRRSGVLQLLRTPHYKVVKLLGGASGRDVDKEAECAKLGFPWMSMSKECEEDQNEESHLVLPGCASYIKLTLLGDLIDAGSHDIALCRVESMLTDDDSSHEEGNEKPSYLSTAALREMGIITEQGRVAEE